MLSHLFIQNYALIRHLDIDFKEGFTVITGETGAGKSILLGALSLILGKRADTQVLLDKSRKCVVEGSFMIGSYDLIGFFDKYDLDFEEYTVLRREINQNGKSRAFINDTPVNLPVIKELAEKLINIHSQYETVTLHDANFQLAVIDSYGGLTNEVNNYRSAYFRWVKLKQKLAALSEQETQAQSELDYIRFLHNELEEAKLLEGEQTQLENELEILNNAEEIKTKLFNISGILSQNETNILQQLAEIRNNLNQLSKYSELLAELSIRVDSSYIELSDISGDIESVMDNISHNPRKSEELKDRLDLIYSLENKHHVNSVEGLLEIKQGIAQKLTIYSSLQQDIESIKAEVDIAGQQIKKQAANISQQRKKVYPAIEKEIVSNLLNLGMPQASFRIECRLSDQPGKDGADTVKFMFNANRGGVLQDLSKVASGGETSRLMLVIKSLISQKNLLPTIIFDEIDQGISGSIADMVGKILLKLSNTMQVIAITHLPQIAGKGDMHYFVFKETEGDQTKTEIKLLQAEERILEIAKMVSGQDLTSASMETAKNLLNN